MITLEQANKLKKGDVIWHLAAGDNTPDEARRYKVASFNAWGGTNRVTCKSVEDGYSVRVMYHSRAWGKDSKSGERWFMSIIDAVRFTMGEETVVEKQKLYIVMGELVAGVFVPISARSNKSDALSEATWRSRSGIAHKVETLTIDEEGARPWLVSLDVRTWAFTAKASIDALREWSMNAAVSTTVVMAMSEDDAIVTAKNDLMRLISEGK